MADVCGLGKTHIPPLALFACLLTVYIEPLLCVYGFISNCLCIGIFLKVLVLRRSRYCPRKRALIHYLIALCVFDACQMLLSLLVLVLPAVEQFVRVVDGRSAAALGKINVYSVRIFYPLLIAANCGSIWTIIVVCAQRYQNLCLPHSSRVGFQFVRRSIRTIAMVTVVAFLLNLVRYFEMQWVLDGESVFINDTALRRNFTYVLFSNTLYLIVTYIVPLSLLTVLSFKIICALRRQQALRKQLRVKNTVKTNKKEEKHATEEQRNALMIVAVIAVFFSCRTLSFVLRLFYMWDPNAEPTVPSLFLADLSNFLVILNSVLNPCLYFTFTRRFKDLYFELKQPARQAHARRETEEECSLEIGQALANRLKGKRLLVSREWLGGLLTTQNEDCELTYDGPLPLRPVTGSTKSSDTSTA